jgi:hypothetical protein
LRYNLIITRIANYFLFLFMPLGAANAGLRKKPQDQDIDQEGMHAKEKPGHHLAEL